MYPIDVGYMIVHGKRPSLDGYDQKDPFVDLMMRCWHQDRLNRPRFRNIRTELLQMGSLQDVPIAHSAQQEYRASTGATEVLLANLNVTQLEPAIGDLTFLQTLDLRGNKLKTLLNEIGRLTALKVLDISQNQLISLPAAIGKLTVLEVLDISRNQLGVLPDEIGDLKNLTTFEWDGNPLASIPKEVTLGKHIGSLLAYLRALRSGPTRPNRCKLLFVGRAGAGKTTLLRRLQADDFVHEPESTAGIDMSQWRYAPKGRKRITFTAWDFAGQRVYYSTHQLFLTMRTVYILCWSLRDAEEKEFGLSFWLHSIQAKAPGSKVILDRKLS